MNNADNHQESEAALVFRANTLTLSIRHALCGRFDGEWDSCIPFARLIYILEAGDAPSWLRHRETTAILSPGSWSLVPAGLPVHHYEQPGLRLVSLHFNVKICSNLEFLSMMPQLFHGDAPGVYDDFADLYDHCDEFPAQFMVRERVWWGVRQAMLQLDHEELEKKIYSLEKFQPLLNLLSEARYPDFDVDRMAKVMKMGRDNFIRQFSRALGTPPGTFFNRMLADRAARMLLARPEHRVAEISDALGFPNEYYFSRFFKRFFKLSPQHYRMRTARELP